MSALLKRARLLAVAAGVGVLALGAAAAPPESKEGPADEKKAEPPRPRVVAGRAGSVFMPDLERLLDGLQGFDPQQAKRLQEEMRRANEDLRKAIEALNGRGGLQVMPRAPARPLGANRAAQAAGARFGGRLEAPPGVLVEQLDLPRGQGLVLEDVAPDSAAAKAGLRSRDVLLEVDGKPVPDHPDDFARLLDGVKADAKVDVVLLRKGKKETVRDVPLPEAKGAGLPNVRPRLPL